MIGAITPLVQAAQGKRRWARAVLAYATGSLIAATLVGGLLGIAGWLLGGPWRWSHLALGILAVGLGLVEFGILPRPPHLIRRQTQGLWRRQFGSVGSAFLWGFDVGMGLTTWVTFVSFWPLVVACVLIANPARSAVLLGGYGLGRVLLVISGLLFLPQARRTFFISWLYRDEREWRRVHGTVLLTMAAVLLLL